MAATTKGNVSLSAALEEVNIKTCSLDILPTELILHIMGYLSTVDLLAMREVDRIFCEVIDDSTLLRTVDLHQCYCVTPHTLWELGYLNVVPSIQSLNISNCYWLKGSQFSTLNPRMPNLKYLDIRGTDVPLKTLDKILSSAETLKSLSLTHPSTMSSNPFSEAATKTLSQLLEMNLVIPSCCNLFFLGHCKSLRAFTLDANHKMESSACRCCPSVFHELPVSRMYHLDVLTAAALRHPLSCSFDGLTFPNEHKALRTLSSSFTKHLRNTMEWIMDLNLPKILSLELLSSDHFPSSIRFSSLHHLNASGSIFTKTDLCSAGRNFSQLRSLNISGCQNVLLVEGGKQLDLSFLEVLVEAKTPLEHLNISGIHLHHGDGINRLTQLLSQLHGLKTLSLPFCCLADNTTSEPLWMTSSQGNQTDTSRSQHSSQSSSSKRQRIGIRVNKQSRCESCTNETTFSIHTKKVDHKGCVYCGSHLARVVNGARQLESLELIEVDFKSILRINTSSALKQSSTQCGPSTFLSVSEDALLCISRLTHLRSLVLAGIPTILHGHSLVAVLQHCKQLRSLSLAHLGRPAQCQFLKGLVEALQYADRLEDLRVEHQNIDQMNSLFRALHSCPSLTRLCVISKNSRVNPEDVFMSFNHCRKLVLLCLMCSLPATVCKDLSLTIMDQYSLSRPTLHAAIGPYSQFRDKLVEFTKRIPSVHLKEFVLYGSRVATTPPSWRELEKMIKDEEAESR